MERGVVPALHFTCWYFIPNPENSKAPDLEVESFFGVAPMRALWFYATAVTAVTMFCTFRAIPHRKVGAILPEVI